MRDVLSPFAATVLKKLEFVSNVCGVKLVGILPSKERLQVGVTCTEAMAINCIKDATTKV